MFKRIFVIFFLTSFAMAAFAAKPKAKAPDAAELAERAEEALIMYDTEALSDALDQWNALLAKGKKPQARPARLDELERRRLAMTNMLDRVEDIVIIDSVSVDADAFLSAIRIGRDAGRVGLNAAMNLPAAPAGQPQTTWYTPDSGTEIFYAAPDSTGHTVIMRAPVLDDRTPAAAVNTGISVADGSNTAFPFLMTDGVTLYFASDADTDGSLGGYDIYRTRRTDDGGFYAPVNMGMPYNSPANDYMLAIDETTGTGWWATDRNAEDGRVTVYTFVTNETRRNIDPGAEDLADRAFITDWRATQPAGFDADNYLTAIDRAAVSGRGDATQAAVTVFDFSLGDGRVLHTAADFKNPQARALVQQWLDQRRALAAAAALLDRLRARYGGADATAGVTAAQIAEAEDDIRRRRQTVKALANRIICAERGL